MIDSKDVKMPVPRKDTDLKDQGKVAQIEELLRLVNEADNKQELRLKQDYYSRFHWFGTDIGSDADKSYFSYQEEAVYDFVFNLNKSGILSDQVGMGKTIEAGMIISELASRNELRSLLIIVPNEILAQKWEYELADKFGIKEYVRGNEVFPTVKALKNMDDFSRCIFDCVCKEKFVEYQDYDFKHTYNADPTKPISMDQLIASFIKEDIAKAVELINNGFDLWEMPGNPHVQFDGSSYSITGTNFKKEYNYDEHGAIASFLKGRTSARMDTAVNSPRFIREYRKMLKQELESMFIVIGRYFCTFPNELTAVSEMMINNNPILVIPIAYSEYNGDNVTLREFLNCVLLKEMKSYKYEYNVEKFDSKTNEVKLGTDYEDYKVVDFFIDVGYQTLIVDEVHDYIDVSAKMERSKFHKNDGYNQYPSSEYNRYELFDDYYFIKKSSLYKKLKCLADKAARKIFLTATPIKSDMVDFYLLTLLASNKDSDAYKEISAAIKTGGGYDKLADLENAIRAICEAFKDCARYDAPKEFCKNPSKFRKEEKRDASTSRDSKTPARYVYPYFNNSFLSSNLNNSDAVSEYLNGHLAYMSIEEILMELIIAYKAETQSNNKSETLNENLQDGVFKALEDIFIKGDPNDLQTRIVFRTILNNSIKLRFEEDFTIDGHAIKQIKALLSSPGGARQWHKTYRKYGIRHTRHQTYNLNDCEDLDKLNKEKMERFRNLPIWPRRDGKVIYLLRDDVFFDSFINVRRELPEKKDSVIDIKDLPNYDKMTGDDEVKAERFENAKKIFDYINNSMSGGDPVNHLPQTNKYDSIEINDSGMVEYKLALVNRLMTGTDSKLGSISKKVLLFAEEGREEILEWFRYQKLEPLYNSKDFVLDPAKMAAYKEKWDSYSADQIGSEWKVSDNTNDLNKYDGNLLIIIDPKRYEKGVDLQKADTIINFDINYDPLKMEQRIGRIDRIRPKGNSTQINIISFVPLNNMSGFVINFFAHELKMFTQWMGETTGIVSVPDESNDASKGQEVSFSGKVYELEKFYTGIYNLCGNVLSDDKINEFADEFSKFFAVDKEIAKLDFKFLQSLRKPFDTAFRNSVSPKRNGYSIDGSSNKVMRFNSANNVFEPCGSEFCNNKCPKAAYCRNNKKRNSSKEFVSSIKEFLSQGEKFYSSALGSSNASGSNKKINENKGNDKISWLNKRHDAFKKEKDRVLKALSAIPDSTDPLTIPLAKYNEIFNPIKKLYWDDVAANYMDKILSQFYKQCDSVLDSASKFENFIKVLSIADFMNNMEGNV